MATILSLEEVPEKSPLVNGMSIFETFTDICHQAEPAVVMHLTNMKLWLSLLAGYPNSESCAQFLPIYNQDLWLFSVLLWAYLNFVLDCCAIYFQLK